VAGIDINTMGRELLASRAACVYPAETLEALSHFVQQKYGIKRYESPILIGYSSGATVVYATLAQSPGGTFKGAVSLGFCPDLGWSKPMCRGEGLEHDPGAKVGFVYRPATRMGDPGCLQATRPVCDPGRRQFVAKVLGAGVMLPKVGHGIPWAKLAAGFSVRSMISTRRARSSRAACCSN
jgi:type IV secretory pathway VirJ component